MNPNLTIHQTAASLAEAAGLSRYIISAVRKAARMEGKPFPNYATLSDLRAWLRSHPNFVARAVFKKPAPPSPLPDQAQPAAGRSDGSPRRHGPRSASPAPSAQPLAPAA